MTRVLQLVSVVISFVALVACSRAARPDGGTGLLPTGSIAPDLVAEDQHGKPYRLADDRGRFVVVFFYPKDATPGCTKEACAFRDAWKSFEEADIRVLGVSSDDRESHERFAREHNLPFSLLVEEDGAWGRGFGVGNKLGYYSRVSFLIGPDGKVAKVYPDVDPALHANEVLADVAKLKKGE